MIEARMFTEGFSVQVRMVEGLSTLVTFEDYEEMVVMLENCWDLFDQWFESLIPLDIASSDKEVRLWIKLEEIPIKLWHLNTFKAVAQCWGDFIGVDRATFTRERLDRALILVNVKSRTIIHP